MCLDILGAVVRFTLHFCTGFLLQRRGEGKTEDIPDKVLWKISKSERCNNK